MKRKRHRWRKKSPYAARLTTPAMLRRIRIVLANLRWLRSCSCRNTSPLKPSCGISTAARNCEHATLFLRLWRAASGSSFPIARWMMSGANKLGLWRLERMDELVVGKWKILEPPRERWGEPGKEFQPEQMDLVIVPGVAFSRKGARMGNGQGYYDRLLERVRPDCPLVGLCYECQLFDDLIVGPHDVFMDKVVTEQAVYQGRGRQLRD